MKRLQDETNSKANDQECAALLMQVIPVVMSRIRREMRSHRAPGLSVPQLRTLIFLNRNEGTSLSAVAEHVGLQLPTMSKTVDSLVNRKLVVRKASSVDRRRINLKLSEQGRGLLMETRRLAEADLSEVMRTLTPKQRADIIDALTVLGAVFAPQKASSK